MTKLLLILMVVAEMDSVSINTLKLMFGLRLDSNAVFRWSPSMAPKGHPRYRSFNFNVKHPDHGSHTIRVLDNGQFVE